MSQIKLVATIIVAVLAAVVAPVAAQEGPSILTLLDVGDRRLTLGTEMTGMLTAMDVQNTGGRRVQAWGLEISGSRAVTVDLRSESFDAFLYVAGPGLSGALEDDDGAGGCDARITFQASSAGMYRVVVSSLAGETGPYTLRVSDTPGPVQPGSCGGGGTQVAFGELPIDDRRITVGDEQTGRLTMQDTVDAREARVQAWGLALDAGQAVAIDLVSDQFDAFLRVTGPGLESPLSDDDGAGGCNARIFFSARQGGEYRVVVGALGGAGAGTFTLRATERPGPVLNRECGVAAEDFSEIPVEGRTLDRDAPTSGNLSANDRVSQDGSHVQAWGIDARTGETLTVTLRSDDFDPFLRLFGPQLVPLSDDDGEGGCDARITFTAPRDGTYRVVVTTAFPTSVGSFVLEVTDTPAPPSTEPCV